MAFNYLCKSTYIHVYMCIHIKSAYLKNYIYIEVFSHLGKFLESASLVKTSV